MVFPRTIAIMGTDETGKEIVETIPYVIRIRDGYGSHETMEPVISDVVCVLNVGSKSRLNLTITNLTTQYIIDGEITIADSVRHIHN